MQFETLESSIGDNYFYLLHDGEGGTALVIDPADPDAALDAASRLGVTIGTILNTHWHPDHTGGNAAIVDATGARLMVPAQEANLIPAYDTALKGGEAIEVGSTTGRVLATPGHTHGHISLLFGLDLFCGDTIFVAGAGNTRFGSPRVLFKTFAEVLSELPAETRFHPGHDYAVRNLEFCLHLEPNNIAAQEKLAEAKEIISADGFVRTTLGEERTYSPFFRHDDRALWARLETNWPQQWNGAGPDLNAPERAFVTVRTLRNSW